MLPSFQSPFAAGAVECAFGGLKQYQILDQKTTHTSLFEPCGALLEENPNITKMDVILSNCIALHNASHPGFLRTFDLPAGVSEQQFGENLLHR